jgi:hypothetical protein
VNSKKPRTADSDAGVKGAERFGHVGHRQHPSPAML